MASEVESRNGDTTVITIASPTALKYKLFAEVVVSLILYQ